ncbi:HTH-type transcriptional regulator DmlR [Vibrio mediterranei]|uniref:LysR family transcriptional regulator n=1 Tax=Vibrio mediterranei TaxID=689 RepID=UPI000783C4C2|nr:LysR family transcriptional regulator [Vibrio mediterranei]MCG9664118.1 LysR family transcriptional regulator [Vibrio mediterranei]PTC06417.1 LysR family transcriptional regulator [Vibrio mediterranei]SBO08997.1 HTH-type transcriptional regulator DmlR [Vibrio mediterranei]
MKELSALPLFAKVVELSSFAEAARQLNVPTTTVSRKIQQLEHDLGGKLLNRSTRSLSLTELGIQVLPKAQLIADTVAELYSDAEDMANQPIGTLTITAPKALSQDLLAPMFAEFRALYPTIRINLASSNRYQDLTKQSIDFAFRLGPLHDSSLVALTLSPVKYVLAASTQYIDKYGEPKHPLELYQKPCIKNHVEGYFLPWRFARNSEEIEITHNSELISDDFNVTKELALHHAGICYLPYSLLRQEIQCGAIKTLLEPWVPQDRTMLLVYPDKRHLPLKSQLFIEFIRNKRSEFSKKLAGTTD